MLIELMSLDAALSQWLKTRHAHICEISPNRAKNRCRPYTAKEIQAMRGTMKRYNWGTANAHDSS
jgi:hypothetical protein